MISNNSYVRTTQNSNEKITGVVNTIKKFGKYKKYYIYNTFFCNVKYIIYGR